MREQVSLSGRIGFLLCFAAVLANSAGSSTPGNTRFIRLRFDKDPDTLSNVCLWERRVLCELDKSAAWAEESTLTDTTWHALRCTPRRVKVGLALGGGVVRGISHIGVLRALEQNNVPIHGVVGSSMGAIIGGLYASGYSPDSLEFVVQDSIDWVAIFRDQPPRTELPLWDRLRDKPGEPGLDLNWSKSGLLPLKFEPGAGIRVCQKFTDEIASRTLESDYRAGFDFDSLCVPFGAMLTNMKTRRSELMRKRPSQPLCAGAVRFLWPSNLCG
jgi:predicted acylesterase/phospholipase RssA